MKIRAIIVIFLTIIISVISFSEIIILKNGKEIKGKIIKTDEDTMTIITKNDEMVIDKDNIANIYYDEKKYDEDKNKKNSIPEKKEISGPHIISSVPENGAIDILHSQTKTITIKFNEAMNKDLSYECSEEINKPKWLDPQTLQIALKNPLDYGKTFNLVLNPSGKKQIMQTKLKILLPPDTIFSFTTKDVKWIPIYTENFNKADTENGNIGTDWKVDNLLGSAFHTAKIKNNELIIMRINTTFNSPKVILNKDLINNKKAIKLSIKLKVIHFINIILESNNEFYRVSISNGAPTLVYNNKYKKSAVYNLSEQQYYLLELIRENKLLLCIIKDNTGSAKVKLSIDTTEDELPDSFKLYINDAGSSKDRAMGLLLDDLIVSVY